MIHSVEELEPHLKGTRILLRSDLNVPIENGTVADPFRLEAALKTISYLAARGARVVLASHMSDKAGSLKPVAEYLKPKLRLTFIEDIAGPAAHAAANALKDGDVLLLENIRRDNREEANDEGFARELASLGDAYVNDAFPVSHRPHASIVTVPKLLHAYAGFQFLAEMRGLMPALEPDAPSLAIVGGAKLVTKVGLIHTLVTKYDKVFVGGALSNDFFAAKGWPVGKSLVSGTDVVGDLLTNPKIVLPETVTVENPTGTHDVGAHDVGENDVIWDIAPSSIEALRPLVQEAKFILWNGPMGNFEKGFTAGTDALAALIAGSHAKSIVGGGDTLSSIQNLHVEDKFTFVSTAGGAMLDFLANGTLPGIEALDR